MPIKLSHLKRGYVIRVYSVTGPAEYVTEKMEDAESLAAAMFQQPQVYKVQIFNHLSVKIKESI